MARRFSAIGPLPAWAVHSLKSSGMEASLYIHIPFCAGQKCDYCDFYSVPEKPGDGRLELYTESLLTEAEKVFDTYRPEKVPTLYIGGGTPSILGAAGIGRLLKGLVNIIARYSPGAPDEITVEANPESADEPFLAAARGGGATRLSLGIQTFYGPSRKAVNRSGAETSSAETLLTRRLALAAEYFPGAFSADLVSGLPFQDEKILHDDIAALLSYKPAHVSLYALTIEEGTPLAENVAGGRLALPEGDEADKLWIFGRDLLEKHGYNQYEVSNFCLSGKESRHNIRYWLMKNWLALGPSASGTIIDDDAGTGLRSTFPPNIGAWLETAPGRSQRPGAVFTEELDTFTLIKESLLMGFRYIEGPDNDLFRRRFSRGIEDFIPKTLNTWRARGLLRKDKAALTKEGLLFLNPFLLDVFRELDSSLTCQY